MSLFEQLTQTAVQQLSRQAAETSGMEAGLAEKLLPMAAAALMGGLKKNAAQPAGAEALSRALDRHDGSLLGQVDRLGQNDVLSDGQKILGHVLGAKQAQTEQALAKTAGVNQQQISQLMAMAAPLVLASLGKAKRDNNLDASSLANLVTRESQQLQQQTPNELGGLLQFLDQDGDNDFKDDILEAAGKKLFGSLLGRR